MVDAEEANFEDITEQHKLDGDNHKGLTIKEIDAIVTPAQLAKKCKQLILAITKDLPACEIKWQLFISAVETRNNYAAMLPYLPEFVKNHTHLMYLINETPNFYEIYHRLMEGMECYNILCILLLHWVFFMITAPKFETFTEEDVDELLENLPQHHHIERPTYVFKLMYDKNAKQHQLFEERCSLYPVKCSFFGCDTDNLFPILCDGFKKQKKNGTNVNGVFLNSESAIVLSNMASRPSWPNASFLNHFRVITLCEFINRENYIYSSFDHDLQCSHIHVQIPDMVRIRYLLFFCETVEKPFSIKEYVMQKIRQNAYVLSMCSSTALFSVLVYINRKQIKNGLSQFPTMGIRPLTFFHDIFAKVCKPS